MEKIFPAFYENNVPICFSINDKYAPIFSVALKSILDNSNEKLNYDIVVLTTGINAENQMNLFSMIKNHKNFSLRFINVGASVYGYNFFIESAKGNTKYSSEIYFRILVPTLMPDYDYVLFLDADILATTDISEIFNNNFDGFLVGAVRDYEGIAACYNSNLERAKYRINELGIKNFEDYFISGVLILNIKMFNSLFSGDELIKMAISKNWIQFDQDLLNYICKDKVKILDARWDFVEDIYGDYQKMPNKLFSEYLSSEKNPKLIHFVGNRKPWKNRVSKYSDLFWKLAEKTPYSFLFSRLKNIIE